MASLVLLSLFLTVTAHDYSVPEPWLKVSPAVIYEMDTVELTCEVPQSAASQCLLSLLGREDKAYAALNCQYSLKGVDLLKDSGQSPPTVLKVICSYFVEISGFPVTSNYSEPSSITVQRPPAPTLTASPLVMKKGQRDKIHLSCATPHSPAQPQCYFFTEGTVDNPYTAPSCRLSLDYEKLIRWAGHNSSAIKMRCSYHAVSPLGQFKSDPSDHVTLTVQSSDFGGTPEQKQTLSPTMSGGKNTDDVGHQTGLAFIIAAASACGFFLLGLMAICLCRMTKNRSGNVVSATSEVTYTMITSAPLSFEVLGETELKRGQGANHRGGCDSSAENDTSPLHVYSSIQEVQ